MLLEMREITKVFPGVKALDTVNLTLKAGEILAIVGENGAGKSTLIKILSGAYQPDKGEILLNGQKAENMTPLTAIKKGIGVIYQELNSVDQLTVAENIFMGNLPRKGRLKTIDYQAMERDSRLLLTRVGMKIHPFTLMEKLSVAEKQLIEIAKTLSKDIKILVMDEPTAALNQKEIKILFGIIKELSAQGIGILYISHRMEEIFQISDRVMVMRDGLAIKTLVTSQTNIDELIPLMVGRKIVDIYPTREICTKKEICFQVKNLSTVFLKQIDFDVHQGEIVGLFGLMGCGSNEIARSIFGADSCHFDEMILNDSPVSITSPEKAKKAGIAYIPSDRKKEGLMLIHNLCHNISITILNQIKKNHLINETLEKSQVDALINKLSIKASSAKVIVNNLSGGNQQKVVLAKWLSIKPKLLILNEPTRGIDVGAKAEIYKLMNDLCRQGIGIIMVSSDLPEVMGMADRILIIHDGQIKANMEKSEFTQDKILAKAIGR